MSDTTYTCEALAAILTKALLDQPLDRGTLTTVTFNRVAQPAALSHETGDSGDRHRSWDLKQTAW